MANQMICKSSESKKWMDSLVRDMALTPSSSWGSAARTGASSKSDVVSQLFQPAWLGAQASLSLVGLSVKSFTRNELSLMHGHHLHRSSVSSSEQKQVLPSWNINPVAYALLERWSKSPEGLLQWDPESKNALLCAMVASWDRVLENALWGLPQDEGCSDALVFVEMQNVGGWKKVIDTRLVAKNKMKVIWKSMAREVQILDKSGGVVSDGVFTLQRTKEGLQWKFDAIGLFDRAK